jgi:hypothetical protein
MAVLISDFSGPQGNLFPSYNFAFLPAENRQPIIITSNQNGLWGSVPVVTSIVGSAGNLSVAFDSLVSYSGAYTHVPTGLPYDIGTPSLALDSRSINVPITVAAQTLTPSLITYVAPNVLTLDWAQPMSVLSTANWAITLDPQTPGLPISISNIDASNPLQTVLTLSPEHTTGAVYLLTVPAYSLLSSGGIPSGEFHASWFGVGVPPQIYNVVAVSPVSFLVTFSEMVDSVSAAMPTNYLVAGLQVHSVAALSRTQYLVTTSTMTPDTTYTLTVNGVKDIAGNAIL